MPIKYKGLFYQTRTIWIKEILARPIGIHKENNVPRLFLAAMISSQVCEKSSNVK